MRTKLLIALLVVTLMLSIADTPVYEVVLFGATGNLASKYLWQALFELADAVFPVRLHVVAVGLASPEDGLSRVRSTIEKSTSCGEDGDDAEAVTACARLRASFLDDVVYISVGNGTYQLLAAHLAHPGGGDSEQGVGMHTRDERQSMRVVSRLLYLAVSPDAYVSILEGLAATSAVPLTARSSPPTRTILEKPIGRDTSSAHALLSRVQSIIRATCDYSTRIASGEAAGRADHASSGEFDRPALAARPSSISSSSCGSADGSVDDDGSLLLMDHYLGKAGVAAAADARLRMLRFAAFRSLVARQLRRVDVVLAEDGILEAGRAGSTPLPRVPAPTHEPEVGVESPGSAAPTVALATATPTAAATANPPYYNEFGVVRDVLSTHGQQILVATLLVDNKVGWSPAGRRAASRGIAVASHAPDPAVAVDSLPPGTEPHRFGFYSGYDDLVLNLGGEEAVRSSDGGDGDLEAGGARNSCGVEDSADSECDAIDVEVDHGGMRRLRRLTVDGRLRAAVAASAATQKLRTPPPPQLPLIEDIDAEIRQREAARSSSTTSPTTAEVWGPRFVAPTAAKVELYAPSFKLDNAASHESLSPPAANIGHVHIVVQGGKALGRRSVYVRHTYDASDENITRTSSDTSSGIASNCGPRTITFHISGRLELPPGTPHADILRLLGDARRAAGEEADVADHAASTSHPAVIMTGWCGAGLPDPHEMFAIGVGRVSRAAGRAETWRHGWGIAADVASPYSDTEPGATAVVHAGVVVAVPRLPQRWMSRRLRDTIAASRMRGVAESPASSVEVEASGALTATTSPDDLALVAARLRATASNVGSSGAYPPLLAAALLGDTAPFVSASEALDAWTLWTPVARLGDAATAVGAALHWRAPAVQRNYERQVTAASSARGPGASTASRVAALATPLPRHFVYLYADGDASWMSE